MGFPFSEFRSTWDHVYHLTHRDNTPRIARNARIDSAATLMRNAGRADLVRVRRDNAISLAIGADAIWLRDHRPLVEANIAFAGAWGLGDLIEAINRRVFFWPGKKGSAITHAVNHYDRFVNERPKPVIIRVSTSDLVELNEPRRPEFCAFNSGAPRMNAGRGSPRGPKTFAPSLNFDRKSSDIVEVVYVDHVQLPASTAWADSYRGPWRPLSEAID